MYYDDEQQKQQNKNSVGDFIKDKAKNEVGDRIKENLFSESNKGKNLDKIRPSDSGGTEEAAKFMEEAASIGKASARDAAASGAAKAAGATGVGVPVAATIETARNAKKVKDAVENLNQKTSANEDYKLSGLKSVLWILVGIIVFFVIMFSTLIQRIIPGPIEGYRESQYAPKSSVNENFTKKGYPTVQKVIDNYSGLEEYNRELPLEDAIIVYRELIDATIQDVFTEFCEKTVKKYDKNILVRFFQGDDLDRDDEKTKENFLNQPYPYCKKTEEGYYTIADYLDGKIPKYEYSDRKNYLNNDINYAEIISILSMNQNYNIMSDSCTLEDFAELLCSDRAKKYLYEMKMTPVFIESEEDTGSLIKKKTGYYYSFEIMPFGLRELFILAGVEKNESDVDFSNQTNYQMLDRKEKYLRTYARGVEYLLGPSYKDKRDSRSLIYGEGANRTLTGRSADYYIQEADNLEDEDLLAEWDDEHRPDVTVDYNYNGTMKIINMPTYINQGTCSAAQIRRGQGDYTIQQAGCIDCVYIMLAEYYNNTSISVKDIAQNNSMYVGNNFNTMHFMNTYNLEYKTSAFIDFDIDRVRNYIDLGIPPVLHISGHWEYNGSVYHYGNSGHFLLIVGYDSTGLYVYDPGSTKNTKSGAIPYEAFNCVAEKYLRDPVKPLYKPNFKYNVQDEENDVYTDNDTKLQYSLYKVGTTKDKPVVFVCHGTDPSSIELDKGYLAAYALVKNRTIQPDMTIVYMRKTNKGSWGNNGYDKVGKAIANIARKLEVDMDRIYYYGFSYGSWDGPFIMNQAQNNGISFAAACLNDGNVSTGLTQLRGLNLKGLYLIDGDGSTILSNEAIYEGIADDIRKEKKDPKSHAWVNGYAAAVNPGDANKSNSKWKCDEAGNMWGWFLKYSR